MTRRYEYKALAPEEFSNAMAQTGFGGETLARLLGTRYDRIRRWEKGEEAIPHYVLLIMTALTVPEAKHLMLAVLDAVCRPYRREEKNDDPIM